MGIRVHNSFSVHPGPWLKEAVFQPSNLTSADVATHLGVGIDWVRRLSAGLERLTMPIAKKLEALVGVRAETLVRMQETYDRAHPSG